jgi:hypothetical protein
MIIAVLQIDFSEQRTIPSSELILDSGVSGALSRDGILLK